jgi:hypothetical protein
MAASLVLALSQYKPGDSMADRMVLGAPDVVVSGRVGMRWEMLMRVGAS